MTRSQSSADSASSGGRGFTPAAFTRMSGSPNATVASAAARRSAGRSPRSAATRAALPPARSSSPTASSSARSPRATSTTLAPAPHSAAAIARPMPELPPVTTTTSPRSENSSSRNPLTMRAILPTRPASCRTRPARRPATGPSLSRPRGDGIIWETRGGVVERRAGQGWDTAFVLGGGGVLGAHEVGMLQALTEAGIRPDLIVGTSVGAINGVLVAADPDQAVARLGRLWRDTAVGEAFSGSLFGRVATLARSGTHLHSNAPLRHMLEELLPVRLIEELAVPFQCVAASVERAAAHWFTRGPIMPAVLASAAVPGLLPAVKVGGEHFFDGGLVHSIPVGRAVALGAREVYVLHVGRIETPLEAPRRPWEVGLVAFEIARRYRFAEEMASLPRDVTVHVLPAGITGVNGQRTAADLSQLRYRDFSRVDEHIERAHEASAAYLAGTGEQG